jgi:sulfide:quinone oxidoreductase
MSAIRWVTPEFAVTGQMAPSDIAAAVAEGFRTIVNNRPDGEEPGQPMAAEIRAAAEAAGLEYRAISFSGAPPPAAVAATAEALEEAPVPVLAYCRSGRRSILAWAMAQALSGARRPDEIVALAAKAGYDVGGAKGALEVLAPKV